MSGEIVTEKSFQLKVNGQGYNVLVKTPTDSQLEELARFAYTQQKEFVERKIAAYLDMPLEAVRKPPFSIPQVQARIAQAIMEIEGTAQPQPENPLNSKDALGRALMTKEARRKRKDDMMKTEIPGADRRAVVEE